MNLESIADDLRASLRGLKVPAPVTHVYNPLEYAWAPHTAYLRRYGKGRREVLLLGMNPGPFGMVQTGVPFGEVAHARDFLHISAPVDRPAREHSRRPIEGFNCTRSEVSGARLWGWVRDRFATPEHFFERFFVANYCPLAFLDEGGRNITPDKLPAAVRDQLHQACDLALVRTAEELQPAFVVGVGQFAEHRARTALKDTNTTVGRILHPSPASPLANQGWAPQAEKELMALGIKLPARRPATK